MTIKNKKINDFKWWQTGVMYQIFPLTFADGNSDGVGDLQIIIKKS